MSKLLPFVLGDYHETLGSRGEHSGKRPNFRWPLEGSRGLRKGLCWGNLFSSHPQWKAVPKWLSVTKMVSEGPSVLTPTPPGGVQAPRPFLSQTQESKPLALSFLRPRKPGPQPPPPSDPGVQTPSPSLPAESGGRALERELPGTVFLPCDVTQEEDVRVSVFSVPTPGISNCFSTPPQAFAHAVPSAFPPSPG